MNIPAQGVSAWGRAQQVVYGVQNLGFKGGITEQSKILVTPESCIACPLNREPEIVSFIQQALAPHQTLLLGSQYQDGMKRVFQAVYQLTNRYFKLVYLKRHAVPCFEQMPRYLENFSLLRNLFRAEKDFSYIAKRANQMVISINGVKIITYLCSDFFLVTSTADLVKLRLSHNGPLIFLLHVNDTWFCPYMRSLLYHVAHMRAWLAGVDLVYVGYMSDDD